MHEESLMRSLLRQVDQLVEQHGGITAEQINVELGPLSGVEALLLEDAFARLKNASSYCDRSRLIIEHVALTVRCLACLREFSMPDFHFVCEDCGAISLKILRGDTLLLRDVQMQMAAE